jgi:hypothetical protein
VSHLLDSRPGRVMRALNLSRGGGTTMPEAMGASTFRYKVVMFVVAALLASVSGWLFAHMQRSVNPSPFGIKFGIEYLFMAVLGGVGSVWGAFTGAALVKLTEDQLQVLLPKLIGTAGSYEIIVFGIVLVVVLKFAPNGLWPMFERFLPKPRRSAIWAMHRRWPHATSRSGAMPAGRAGHPQDLRRPAGRQRHQLFHPRRRHRRPDRPQRRGQEHHLQPHQRCAAADQRPGAAARPAGARPALA